MECGVKNWVWKSAPENARAGACRTVHILALPTSPWLPLLPLSPHLSLCKSHCACSSPALLLSIIINAPSLSLCRARRVQLQWPKAGGEAARAGAGNLALLQAWRAELPARTFCTLTSRSAVLVGLMPLGWFCLSTAGDQQAWRMEVPAHTLNTLALRLALLMGLSVLHCST